jgi:prophage regulatory protein
MSIHQLPTLLSKTDLCGRLGVSVRTIENMVKAGDFPPPVRVGKHVFWSEKAVHSWQTAIFCEQEAWQRT